MSVKISELPAASGANNSDKIPVTQGATTYYVTRAQLIDNLLLNSNNLSDVSSPSTARTNLGLGELAEYNIGNGLVINGNDIDVDSSLLLLLTGGALSGLLEFYVDGNVTAAGSTQGDARPISRQYTICTTVASGTGVILPSTATNTPIHIRNAGANTLTVYPNSGAAINSLSANAGASLAVGAAVTLIATSSTQWYTF